MFPPAVFTVFSSVVIVWLFGLLTIAIFGCWADERLDGDVGVVCRLDRGGRRRLAVAVATFSKSAVTFVLVQL